VSAIARKTLLLHVVMVTGLAAGFAAFASGVAAAEAGDGHAPVPERVEGVVTETRKVGGRNYATISLGSDDGVRRHTRLMVVSQKGEFLGYVTVTNVEPEEAIGVLRGRRADEIRPNDRVTDRLPGEDDDGRARVASTPFSRPALTADP
jgi:hypothetical protein